MYVNSTKMRMLCIWMTIVLTVGLMPFWTVPVKAEEKLSVSGTDGGYTQDENGNITITNEGTYTITGTGDTTSDTISIASGLQNVNITLDNVNIDATNSTTSSSAFKLVFNNNVSIDLLGDNTLIGCDGEPGLEINNGSKLTISGDGSLKAVGGDSAAGIGGGEDNGSCGNIVISGGTISADGSDGAADIGHGAGSSDDGSLVIIGASVNADNIGPSTVYYDTDQTTPAYLTKVTVGETPFASEDIICTINNSISANSSTDENGILYLWLPESSSTTVDIMSTSNYAAYNVTGAIAASYDNELTADIIPIKIHSLPSASEINSGSSLSNSTLTGGIVITDSDEMTMEITGKFSWTNPDTVITSSGNYSATFTPDYKGYESITCMVYVMVKNDNGTTELSINDGSVDISLSGDYLITGTGAQTSNTITVDSGIKGVNITIDNVNIDSSSVYNGAFVLDSDNDVSLTLVGNNILKSGINYAGIKVENGSSLTISGDGSLTANGGEYGAGLGGNGDPFCEAGNCGNITINGGVINATGGSGSAGIGGGGTVMGTGGGNGGNVIINGGTVVATGGEYAADIGVGSSIGTPSNGTLTITGGSVYASNIGPTVYYDTDQTTPAYLTKVTVGATPVKSENVTYKINGGSSIKASTDENGILYLWLAQNNELEYYNRSTTIDITAGGTTYTVSGAISGSSDNELTALLVPKITTLPTASSVTTGDKLSSSVLTGGVAEGINGEKLTGIFSWTYPDEVLSTTNLYTVTFTPDNSNYKSVTFIVEVPVDAKEYSINDGSVEISQCGTYKITGTGVPTTNTIKVNKGLRNVYITLDNVNIDASATASSAFSLEYGDSIFLVLKGDNVLKGGSLGAGLKIGSTSDIYILGNMSEDKADGTLTAIGGNKGAGIGGSGNGSDNSCGKIISQEAFVNAIGGAEAAGIGGGAGGNGGDILVLGGSIVTKGNGGAADIGHGSGSSNDGSVTIEYGSVKAENMGPSTVYYDYNKTIPAYLTKVALGVSPLKSQYFLYVIDDSGSISSSTDENGIFYLWLPESSSSKLYLYWKNELYKASGAIAASNDNMLTAMADSRIAQLPTASSVLYGHKLSESKLSGGTAFGIWGKEITGKFTWDDPNAIIKTPNSCYSVTFTPDNPNYKCSTTDVNVIGIQEDDDDIPSGNSGGSTTVSGGNATASNTSKTTADTTISANVIDVQSIVSSNGTVTSNIADSQVSEALNKASTQQDGNKQTLEIKVSGSDSATGFSTNISNTSLEKINKDEYSLDIDTQVGSVKFDSSALKTIEKDTSGSVSISIVKADPSSLPPEKQAEIGNRPVYKLTVTSGEKNISDFGDGTATVSIPYTLKDGEDPNKIVVYYITESGELKTVVDCVYDASKDCVIFKTNHFSNYMIGYNDVTFSDLSGWYENYVNFIAARNIMTGFGNGEFSPSNNITRAQFVTMLAKLYGKDLSAYNHSSFEDVSKSDWYFAAVQWAYDNGIVNGSEGKFNPNAYVTREQLALMLYNYANYADIHISSDEGLVAEKFSDYDDISKWAKGPIEWASKLGIISGDDKGYFRPKKIATRAEAAKVIYAFLHEVTK